MIVNKSVPRSMQKNIVPSKWVFKKKLEQDSSIRFKSRVVTKGYLQVFGVDYTESFSPVASSVSVKMCIGLVLYYEEEEWVCEVIDTETAFLEGDIEVPMYIEWPEGMMELGFISKAEKVETCAELQKGMYGNVDAALRFYKTYSKHLIEQVKMKKCRSDPCVFVMKENDKPQMVALIHVDDTMLCGKKKAIEFFKEKVKERFNIKELGQLKKHLGVWYCGNKSREERCLGRQPCLN